jgi:hypothetical protein
MTDYKPRVAIVGAGPSGLAAAHHLADTHQVWLFDRQSTAGGVWANTSDQTYDWLETNTPTALFPFPGFPLAASDWEKGTSKGPYVPGRVAQRYYARFAHVNQLDDLGRLEKLKLGTTILEIRRPSIGTSSSRWLVTFRDGDKGGKSTLPFDRLVIASGSFCSPYNPASLRMPVEEGIAFHSSSFGSPEVSSRLSKANKVVIFGAGKSAQDVLAHIMRSKVLPKSITLVMPSHGKVSSWPLPHGRGPSYFSRLPLFASRHLSPWPGSSRSNTWLETNHFGRAVRRYYWSSLAIQARKSYPLLFPPPTSNPTEPWRDILRSTTRLFPAPSGLGIEGEDLSVVHAELINVVHDKDGDRITLHLIDSNGETHTIDLDSKDDLILACTGYRPPSGDIAALFINEQEASKMGVPVSGTDRDQEWQFLVEERSN